MYVGRWPSTVASTRRRAGTSKHRNTPDVLYRRVLKIVDGGFVGAPNRRAFRHHRHQHRALLDRRSPTHFGGRDERAFSAP
jgi:hypothetical protein